MCNSSSSCTAHTVQRDIFKPKNSLFLLKGNRLNFSGFASLCKVQIRKLSSYWPGFKAAFCFALAASAVITLQGQQYIERHYLLQPEDNINRQLLQNSILGIQADENGELWLASSFGLLQTDGIDTRIWLRKNSITLRTDRYKAMYRRRDNNQILLMDAYGGLVTLQSNGRMQRIRSHADSAFVGYAGQAWKINRRDWKLPADEPSDIVAKQIAYNGGLAAFRIGNTWYHAPGSDAGDPDHPVIASCGAYRLECRNKTLQLSGPAGIIRKRIDPNPYFLWFTDTLVVFGSDSSLYFCDLNNGTLREAGELSPYRKGEVYCGFPVSRNSFMLGTYDHGLLRLTFTPATLLNGRKPGQGGAFIYSYTSYRDTQLLIPTGGLLAMDTGEQHIRRLLASASVGHPILCDSRGIVWVHDDYNIVACRLSDRKVKRLPGNKQRYDLFFEFYGKVYATASDRVYQLDFESGQVRLQLRIPNAYGFFNFRKDGEDAWLLSQSGAYRIDAAFQVKSHILKHIPVRDGVKIGETWFWATYGRGLLVGLNPNTHTPAFSDPYDWSLAAVSLRYDPRHEKLWLVSNKAIFILTCDKTGLLGRFQNMLECGLHLPARELNGGNYPEAAINRLPDYYFASGHGLLKIPRNIHLRSANIKLRLMAIVSGKDTIADAAAIRLDPDYAFLSVRIRTTQPFAAENSLSYRIAPTMMEWRPIPESHIIGPLKLPPGDYTLELHSLDGLYKKMQIHIPPYWYNTLWFRILTACCIAIAAMLWLHVRTRKLKKRKAELVYEVNQRTHQLRTTLLDLEASRREVTEAYETREKMNAVLLHDIRSPLMFLTESAYRFNQRLRTEAPQYFATFNLFASTIKDLYLLATDFNLWLKRPLDGRLPLKAMRAADLVDDVVRFYQPIIESGTNVLSTEILEATPELQITTHAGIFKSILRNLLDNSNKYTPGGRIHLKICQAGESLLIQVEDSGSGLPDDILRIYGVKDGNEGNWILEDTSADEIGLNLILRFTRMLNGRLVYRHDANGSVFTLQLPLHA